MHSLKTENTILTLTLYLHEAEIQLSVTILSIFSGIITRALKVIDRIVIRGSFVRYKYKISEANFGIKLYIFKHRNVYRNRFAAAAAIQSPPLSRDAIYFSLFDYSATSIRHYFSTIVFFSTRNASLEARRLFVHIDRRRNTSTEKMHDTRDVELRDKFRGIGATWCVLRGACIKKRN